MIHDENQEKGAKKTKDKEIPCYMYHLLTIQQSTISYVVEYLKKT